MTRWPARRRVLGALLAALAVLPACSLQTLGATKGNMVLRAEFSSVDQLVPGHSVQVDSVTVGSVTGIRLDGYRALVTMALKNGQRIPADATAVIRQTSLLGENFVDLDFPPGDRGPYLRSGDTIRDVSVAPDLEQLTQQSIQVFGALSARDVAGTVQAGAEGLGGHGADLQAMLSNLKTFGDMLRSQSGSIGALTDTFARLVTPLAANSGDVAGGVGALNQASQVLAANRDRTVASTRQLLALASAMNDTVLGPHTDQTIRVVEDLSTMFGVLAQDRQVLDRLIVNNADFTAKIGDAIRHGATQTLSQIYSDSGPKPPAGVPGGAGR